MPIYSYKCKSCGNVVKKLQSMNSEPLTVCEECGGKLEKQIGRVGIKFSGSGYYVTDSKKSTVQTSVPDSPASTKSESKKSSEKTTVDSKTT